MANLDAVAASRASSGKQHSRVSGSTTIYHVKIAVDLAREAKAQNFSIAKYVVLRDRLDSVSFLLLQPDREKRRACVLAVKSTSSDQQRQEREQWRPGTM